MSMTPEHYVQTVLDREQEAMEWSSGYHCGNCWREEVGKLLIAAMAEERRACKEIALELRNDTPCPNCACTANSIARRIEMRGESND